MHILDALEATWILVIFFVAFAWVPALVFARPPDSDAVMRVAGNCARAVLAVTVVVPTLGRLRALNATTIFLLFAGSLITAWLGPLARSPSRLWESLQATTISSLRWIETWSFGRFLLPHARRPSPVKGIRHSGSRHWLQVLEHKGPLLACLGVVLLMTGILSAGHAVRELRLAQSGEYDVLLHAREFMVDFGVGTTPLVFPAVIASISLLSSTDPMQVTRFLSPVAGILSVLAVGVLLRTCTRSSVASIAAMYCLGAAAFPPVRDNIAVAISVTQKLGSAIFISPASIQTTSEFKLGLLFLLLALALLADWYKNSRGWDSLLDFACCGALVTLISRSLLLILLAASAALLFRPIIGLVIFITGCFGAVAYATLAPGMSEPSIAPSVLPVAAALGVGCLFVLAELAFGLFFRRADSALLIAGLALAAIWFPPRQPARQYLEYDSAARVTQSIAARYPRQKWQVAAPVEQLAETFGLGGYEDLASFVETYGNRVSKPEFHFPDAREDLFIYVEKRPFQVYSQEPEDISFPVLTDVTYRNYRSPAGRASLESVALELCENYQQHHSNIDIFFEDDDLRIYHIHQEASETAQSGN